MKKAKTTSLILVLIMGSGFILLNNLTNTQAVGPIQLDDYIASYSNSIVIDGSADEWDPFLHGITLYNYSDAFGNPMIYISYAFAYNESHLLGVVIVENSYGQANALDWHFFGKPGQDDGFHLNAQVGWFTDMVFGVGEVPLPDPNNAGINDGFGFGSILTNITIFEFAKPLDSGDTAGKDISLAYGNSIAVEFAAWIDVSDDANPPNYGSSPPGELGYIRLSIGEDYGDELELTPPAMPPKYWAPAYNLDFVRMDAPVIGFDGILSESEWSNAIHNSFILDYYEWDTGYWDPSFFIQADIYLIYDINNFYIALTVENPMGPVSPELSFLGIALGFEESFYDNPDGFDLILVNGLGEAIDTWMPGDHIAPMVDSMLGGYNDCIAGAQLDDTQFTIELSRPLNTGDDTNDANFQEGDVMYLAFVASFDYGPPNFVSIIPINFGGGEEPAMAIYNAKLEPHEFTAEVVAGDSLNVKHSGPEGAFDLDGHGDDTIYSDSAAEYLTVELSHIDFDSGIDLGDKITINLTAVCDDSAIYAYLEINRALDGSEDWFGVLFSHTSNPFTDPEGADFALMGYVRGYQDMFFEQGLAGEPILDTDNGGSRDGEAFVILDPATNTTQIEFFKLLNPPDANGHDLHVVPGDTIFAMFLISYHSSDGGPNYFEVELQVDQPPKFYVHAFNLLEYTEETTTETSPENTLVIGFSLLDSLVLMSTATVVLTVISKRRKRNKLNK